MNADDSSDINVLYHKHKFTFLCFGILAKYPDSLAALVHELLELCKSTNKDVCHAAAECLGEIGPVNFGCVTLKGQPMNPSLIKALAAFETNNQAKRNCNLFYMLDEFLLDSRYSDHLNTFSFIPIKEDGCCFLSERCNAVH